MTGQQPVRIGTRGWQSGWATDRVGYDSLAQEELVMIQMRFSRFSKSPIREKAGQLSFISPPARPRDMENSKQHASDATWRTVDTTKDSPSGHLRHLPVLKQPYLAGGLQTRLACGKP